MDPEAQVLLADIRVDGVSFSVASLEPPFCVRGPSGPLSLCYVVRGAGIWLEFEAPQRKTIGLEPGTFVGLSGLVPHWFKSNPDLSSAGSRPFACEPLGPASRVSGKVELLIGHAPIEALALTNTVTGAVVVPPDDSRIARRLKRAVEGIEDELRDPDPSGGTSAVVRRLAETILLNMTRYVVASPAKPEPPLGALADIRIMRALAAAARSPLEPWTVDSLAKLVGMSRTAFARQFRVVTGQSPILMLAQIRLRTAAEALGEQGVSLEEAAALAGYGSAAAFIRAFRKVYHTTPAQWRTGASRAG